MEKTGIVIVLSGLCLVSAAHAEPYLGINLGASMVTIAKDVTYLQTESRFSDKYSGFRGQLLVGYDIHSIDEISFSSLISDEEMSNHDEFYFAIEVDGNYNAGTATEKTSQWFLTTDASVKEDLRYSYDVFALAKYRFNQNIIVFLGPGYTQGKFKVTSSDTGGNLGVSGSHDEKVSGWTAKAGMEVPMSKCFSVTATYQFVRYNNKSLEGTEPLTGVNVAAKYQPDVNSLMLGVNVRM